MRSKKGSGREVAAGRSGSVAMRSGGTVEEILSRAPPTLAMTLEEQEEWHWLQFWALRQRALENKQVGQAILAQEQMRVISLSPRPQKRVDVLEEIEKHRGAQPYSRVDQEAEEIIRQFQEVPYRGKEEE